LSFLENLEKDIDRRLRALFRGGENARSGPEIIEIEKAILEDLESRIERLPRDRRVFPFNDVTARIAVPSPERRAAFELVFLQDESLQHQIPQYLRQKGAEVPADFRFHAELRDNSSPSEPFQIICRNRRSSPGDELQTGVPPVHLRVLEGSAGSTEYSLRQRRINLGRLEAVRNSEQRVIRRNDVAFADSSEPPAATVSRAHAHIEYDADASCHRLFDDGSRFGTSVVRDGEVIRVPTGAGRGLRLAPGDEIHLGNARIAFQPGLAETA
jgi:hypothetical protein